MNSNKIINAAWFFNGSDIGTIDNIVIKERDGVDNVLDIIGLDEDKEESIFPR